MKVSYHDEKNGFDKINVTNLKVSRTDQGINLVLGFSEKDAEGSFKITFNSPDVREYPKQIVKVKN